MKIYELLLEFKEIIDSSLYGAWVNAYTKEIIPVEQQHGHEDVIFKLDIDGKHNPQFEPYDWAFSNHMVRVVFHQRGGNNTVGIEGRPADLKQAAPILLASCLQPNVNVVDVDTVAEDGTAEDSHRFTMPEHRRHVMMTLRGETE